MPEPAAVKTEELTFKTEAEKIAALERLQERDLGPDDVDEIDRVHNAKVLESDVPAQPQASAEAQPASVAAPKQEPPAQQAGEKASEQTDVRNWQINEDILGKYDEEYTDHGGRRRRTFLAKDAEGFVKSAADAQRYIRFLENKKMPDAENAGYVRARRELDAEVARLKQELEAAKAAKQAAPQQQVQAQPQGQAAPQQQTDELETLLGKLKGVSEDDLVDHAPTMLKALVASVAQIGSLKETIKRIDTEGPTALKGLEQKQKEAQDKADADRKAQTEADRVRQEQEEKRKQWESGCRMIDTFQGSPDCPKELKMDQGMQEATADAMRFHNDLAILYTGKPAHEITDIDTANAATAYVAGLPELTAKVKNSGISEPDNYRKWVVLDQFDALRVGLYRDPQSKQWKQRYDPASGRPVTYSDVATSYREYLAMTGQDKARAAQAVQQNTQQIISAIQTRDKTLISMDESKAMQNGQPGVLGEQQAVERITQLEALGGVEEAQRRARGGDNEMLTQYNQALAALGAPAMA